MVRTNIVRRIREHFFGVVAATMLALAGAVERDVQVAAAILREVGRRTVRHIAVKQCQGPGRALEVPGFFDFGPFSPEIFDFQWTILIVLNDTIFYM